MGLCAVLINFSKLFHCCLSYDCSCVIVKNMLVLMHVYLHFPLRKKEYVRKQWFYYSNHSCFVGNFSKTMFFVCFNYSKTMVKFCKG